MSEEKVPPAPAGNCPICDATNAFVEALADRDAVFVECVNCRVYQATRKAFRHFEYLRWRQDPAGLHKLDRLGAGLKQRKRVSSIRLDYDTWELVSDELSR